MTTRDTPSRLFIAGQLKMQWDMTCIGFVSMRAEPDSLAFAETLMAMEQTFNQLSHAVFGNEISEAIEVERCEFLTIIGMTCDRPYGGGHPGHHHILEPTTAYTEFFDGHERKREADDHTLSVNHLSIVGRHDVSVMDTNDDHVILQFNDLQRPDYRHAIKVPVGGVFEHDGRTWKVTSTDTGATRYGTEYPIVTITAADA